MTRWNRPNPCSVGCSSPWGTIQHDSIVAPGVHMVDTAGHGGLWVAPHRRAELPPGWRKRAWLEEDCEASIGILFLRVPAPPQVDPKEWHRIALATVWRYFPEIDTSSVRSPLPFSLPALPTDSRP